MPGSGGGSSTPRAQSTPTRRGSGAGSGRRCWLRVWGGCGCGGRVLVAGGEYPGLSGDSNRTRLPTRYQTALPAHHHCAFTNIEATSESNGAQQSGRSTPLQPNDPAAASMLALRLSAANPQPVARRNCLPADWRERPPAGRSEMLRGKRIHLSPQTCRPQAQKRPAYPKNLSNRTEPTLGKSVT